MMVKNLRSVLPDVIICLNGVLPESHIFHQLRPIPIAAADGAAIKLREKGILPQYIIGDLDSLAHELSEWRQHKQIHIHEVSDQNQTDFEKTLDFIIEQHCDSALILGMHGGEFDHTLNNWSILIRYGRRKNLAVYEAGKMALPIYESVQLTVRQGDMISLIPQPSAILTTQGLEWNLYNEELALGSREGARNQAVSETVTIYLHSGSLLLFLKTELPYMLAVST
ncbi:MAG: thiamine diphosphokinase [Candidatus Kapaibacteriota bacterium]|jgi:thiamine pyrophosphokinase